MFIFCVILHKKRFPTFTCALEKCYLHLIRFVIIVRLAVPSGLLVSRRLFLTNSVRVGRKRRGSEGMEKVNVSLLCHHSFVASHVNSINTHCTRPINSHLHSVGILLIFMISIDFFSFDFEFNWAFSINFILF